MKDRGPDGDRGAAVPKRRIPVVVAAPWVITACQSNALATKICSQGIALFIQSARSTRCGTQPSRPDEFRHQDQPLSAAFIGAAPFERTSDRLAHRNGTRPKTVSTTA